MTGLLFITPQAALNHLLSPIQIDEDRAEMEIDVRIHGIVNKQSVLQAASVMIEEKKRALRELDLDNPLHQDTARSIRTLQERRRFIQDYCKNPIDVRGRV
jgi:hypothetical protein